MKRIIKRPLITEKSLSLAAHGWYTFLVDVKARKEDIAEAIAKFYTVTVTNIRTAHMHGKMRRVGRMMKYVKKSDTKKAMVQLAEGQKIDAFEVTAPTEEKPREEKSASEKK